MSLIALINQHFVIIIIIINDIIKYLFNYKILIEIKKQNKMASALIGFYPSPELKWLNCVFINTPSENRVVSELPR